MIFYYEFCIFFLGNQVLLFSVRLPFAALDNVNYPENVSILTIHSIPYFTIYRMHGHPLKGSSLLND